MLHQPMPTPRLPTHLVPKSLLCMEPVLLEVVSWACPPGLSSQKDCCASPGCSVSGQMSPPFILQTQMQNADGTKTSPQSFIKIFGSGILQNSDFRKVIERLCTIVTPMVGLSSNTFMWIFILNRRNSLGQILPPNEFIGSFPLQISYEIILFSKFCSELQR